MNSKKMLKTNNRLKALELSVLFLFLALYVWNISHYFWTLPAMSDPAEYLGPVSWGSTYGYWPWLDRLTLAIGLRIFTFFVKPVYMAGPIYTGFISVSIFIIAVGWLYLKKGFFAAFILCVIFNVSFFMLGYSTYTYPIQNEAFFTLLAFIMFSLEESSKVYQKKFFLAGIFSAFAIFSKITGAFALFYFIVYCLHNKAWRDLKNIFFGFLTGTLITFVAFILLFNYESFFNVIYSFIGSREWYGIKKYTNLVSFLEQILSVNFLPVFISLFVVVEAYKFPVTRNLFCFAWADIALIYFIYTFTHRGGLPISPYIYSAYIFTAIGLAYTLDDVIGEEGLIKNNFIIGVVISSVFLMFTGFYIGIKYPVISSFRYSYLYRNLYYPVFNRGHISLPEVVRYLYTLGPIIVLVLLLITQINKSKKAVVSFILLTSLWGAAFHGGVAFRKAKWDMYVASFFYKAAPLLSEVPNKSFSIYVKCWSKYIKPWDVVKMYHFFFNKKYLAPKRYDSQVIIGRMIKNNIAYIRNESDLKNIKGKQILTDDLGTIKKYFPKFKVVKVLKWGKIKLFVIDTKA